MISFKTICVVFLTCALTRGEQLVDYENCNGLNQSPVNIDLNDVSRRSYPPIIFRKYNKKWRQKFTTMDAKVFLLFSFIAFDNSNQIKTFFTSKVKLEAKENRTTDLPYVRAGGLPAGKFIYAQMHFHLGFDSGTGRKHLI